MDLISEKFKYLFQAQSLLGKTIVPAFKKIDAVEEINMSTPLILRSSLKGEAQRLKLMSGKSLSIPNIKTSEDFQNAYQQIKMQIDLEEIILQEEIDWDQHLTVIHEQDFIFIESIQRDRIEKPQFGYWTPAGHTTKHSDVLKSLNKLLFQIKSITHDSPLWLMEFGLKNNQLYLFQIQPIDPAFLGKLFSQNLVQEMLLSRQRFQKRSGLLNMIKTEWSAYNFRKKFKHTTNHPPSWIFLNWEFIFHYFRIYCLQKNVKPDQNSFARFLATGHQKNWMGEILRLHFKMANQLRLNESFDETSFVFDQDPAFIFIGSGKMTGRIGSEILMIESLTPEKIYALKDQQTILTKTHSLLSHGILAAIEKKLNVVAGIPDEFWEKLNEKDQICLDFDARLLTIQ